MNMYCKNLLHQVLFLCLFSGHITICSAKEMTILPFRQVGNLVLVEATVNGKTGEFILDTGAPEVIVNRTHFEGMHIPWALSEVIDFHGRPTEARHLPVKELSIGGMEIRERYALCIDMRHIERLKQVSLMGIIGYSALQDLEVLFDFDRSELVLTRIKKRKDNNFQLDGLPDETFDLRISGHIPYVVAKINGKKMRLGIDSGAEVNVLHPKTGSKLSLEMDGARKLKVSGITHDHRVARSATVHDLTIDDYAAGPLDVTLISIHSLNESLPIELDGILGVPFLKTGKMAINYKKRKLYMWENEGPLVEEPLTARGGN